MAFVLDTAEEFDLLSESFELSYLFGARKNLFESFDSLRGFSEFILEYDKFLLRTIGVASAAVEYELVDVEYGSLRTKIAQIIRGTPDDAIKDLSIKKLIGHYLLKAKYRLLKWLEKNQEVDNKQQLQTLQAELNADAAQLKAEGLIIHEINLIVLVMLLDKGQIAFQKLKSKEEFEYKSDFGTARVNSNTSLNKPKLLFELGQQSYEATVPVVLKLKRIELLDDKPKWTFLQGKKSITALITDTEWLVKYHERQIAILPEDCIKAELKTIYTVVSPGHRGETHYEIPKVYDVLKPDEISPGLFT